MAYTPVEIELGELPECPGGVNSYSLEKVPSEAKEILVYSFVTTNNDGPFQRGYYTLSTSEILLGGTSTVWPQYLNVATGEPAVTVNSGNMWFPMGNSGQLQIKLTHPSDPKTSIAHKKGCVKQGEWSNVFVIGYR